MQFMHEEILVDLKRSSICTRHRIEINVLLVWQIYIVQLWQTLINLSIVYIGQINSIIILNEAM